MSCILRTLNYMRLSISTSWRKLRYNVTTPFIRSRFLKNDDKIEKRDLDSTKITHPGLKFVLSEHEEKIKSYLNIDGINEITGTGSYAQCYVAVKKSRDGKKMKEFALKVYSTKYISPLRRNIWHQRAQREIYLLDLCSHPNMVKRFDSVFLDGPTRGIKCHVAILMERLDCTLSHLLKRHVKKYSIEASILLAKQISYAIEWMHRKGVSHHDLKSKNIMLVKRPSKPNIETKLASVEYKVIDLGFARFYTNANDLETKFNPGTSFYSSREKKKCLGYNPFLSDAFALGVILLETLVGYNLIRRQKPKAKSFTNVCARYRTMLQSEGNDNDQYMWYLDAIEKLINDDVNERSGVDAFIKVLNQF